MINDKLLQLLIDNPHYVHGLIDHFNDYLDEQVPRSKKYAYLKPPKDGAYIYIRD